MLKHCPKDENLRIVTHAQELPPGRCEVIQVSMGVEGLYDSPARRAPQAVTCANGHHCTMRSTAQTFNLKPFSVNVCPSSLGKCNTNCSHLICELLRVMMIKEPYTVRGRTDRRERKGHHCECRIYVLLSKGVEVVLLYKGPHTAEICFIQILTDEHKRDKERLNFKAVVSVLRTVEHTETLRHSERLADIFSGLRKFTQFCHNDCYSNDGLVCSVITYDYYYYC